MQKGRLGFRDCWPISANKLFIYIDVRASLLTAGILFAFMILITVIFVIFYFRVISPTQISFDSIQVSL